MSRVDTKGRIMGGHPAYGRICDCGNLKGWQSRMCWACYGDSRQDQAYWDRRTCECGGPKSHNADRCLDCANERRRGQPGQSRVQPADHPWRRSIAA